VRLRGHGRAHACREFTSRGWVAADPMERDGTGSGASRFSLALSTD
jgi:hypothetical protein